MRLTSTQKDAALQLRAERLLAEMILEAGAPSTAEITGAWGKYVYLSCTNDDTGEFEETQIDTTGLRDDQLGSVLCERAERIKFNSANREYGRLMAAAFESVFSKHPDLIRQVYSATRQNQLNPVFL